MEWILTKKNRMPTQTAAQVRICMPEDIPALLALQDRVLSALPDPELFVPNTQPEMEENIAQHLTVGVWAEGQPIALGIVRYAGQSEKNYASKIGIPESEWKYWANFDTVVVDPVWRGNKLQQKLLEVCFAWRKAEIIGMACTVSPYNLFSLENVQKCGFRIAGRRTMYGGRERYLLARLMPPVPGRYRHFKGGEYRVLHIGRHSETGEQMVVYRALYGAGDIWVRPVSMWFEHVDNPGHSGPRFVYIGE